MITTRPASAGLVFAAIFVAHLSGHHFALLFYVTEGLNKHFIFTVCAIFFIFTLDPTPVFLHTSCISFYHPHKRDCRHEVGET